MPRRESPSKDARDDRRKRRDRPNACSIERSDDGHPCAPPTSTDVGECEGQEMGKKFETHPELMVYPNIQSGSGDMTVAVGHPDGPAGPTPPMPGLNPSPPQSIPVAPNPLPPLSHAIPEAAATSKLTTKHSDIWLSPAETLASERRRQDTQDGVKLGQRVDDNLSKGYSRRAYQGSQIVRSRQGSGDSSTTTASSTMTALRLLKEEQESESRVASHLEKEAALFFNNYNLSSEYSRSPERRAAFQGLRQNFAAGDPHVPTPTWAAVPRYAGISQHQRLELSDDGEYYFLSPEGGDRYPREGPPQ